MEDPQETLTAAQILVRSLAAQGVKHIFGIPGGKIMPAFNALNDAPPEMQLIVCRHEQNAAFMAGGGWTTDGTTGCMSGDLRTGDFEPCDPCVATATSEGDAMVAIGGVVSIERYVEAGASGRWTP